MTTKLSEELARKRQHRKYTPSSQNPTKRKPKATKKQAEKEAIADLEKRALEYVSLEEAIKFSDLPISEATKRGESLFLVLGRHILLTKVLDVVGLKKAFFVDMTDIQQKSLPISLKGKDVLGAAQTGSGKTLAFLIPTLEILYRRKWGPTDGLGALIISPTRELAVQIFEVLRSIGGHHTFSAGLVIGGKDLNSEKDRLSRMNILVATPGRLLQHMDQTVGFDADNLQVLVLDEADRILDMGFSRTLAALLAHLPKTRQTLLFSATQTQSIADLARLSLKNPVHVGIQESQLSSTSTSAQATDPSANPSSTVVLPQNLSQHYIVCPLPNKLSTLFSFIKTHLQSKTLVFLSSCKQVRFVFETFCKMHPGIPLLQLHGKQKQSARLTMYQRYSEMKHAVLFATDIAARGLDFPGVDWVLQIDAPEDGETYIHRVGRTARYDSKGKALLFLLPSEEEGMMKVLEGKGAKVEKIKIKESKTKDIRNVLQKMMFEDKDIKYIGQRAFVSYLRSIYLHKDKSIFKLAELPIDEFAESLGLPGTPKVKFLSKEAAKRKKNAPKNVDDDVKVSSSGSSKISGKAALPVGNDSEDDEDAVDEVTSDEEEDKEGQVGQEPPKVRTKYDRMFGRKNQKMEHYAKHINDSDDEGVKDDGNDDFITLKRADHGLDSDNEAGHDVENQKAATEDDFAQYQTDNLSKRQQKMSRAKRTIATGGLAKKLVYDDDGNPHELYELADADDWVAEKGGMRGVVQEGKAFAEEGRGEIVKASVRDREEMRERRREKKRKRKERERNEESSGPAAAYAVVDGATDMDDGYVSPEFDLPSSDEDESEVYRPPPTKKAKFEPPAKTRAVQSELEDEEELALKLLRGGV